MNYQWLVERIKSWATNAAINGEIDAIIAMAEARINDDILIKSIEKQEVATTANALAFMAEDLRRIQRLTIMLNGKERTVGYVAPSAAESFTGTFDNPFGYTVLDQAIHFFPSPDREYEYTLYYIPKVYSIVGATDNWLIKERPDIYLFCCLIHAAIFVKDREMTAFYEDQYATQLTKLKGTERGRHMPREGNAIRMSRSAV